MFLQAAFRATSWETVSAVAIPAEAGRGDAALARLYKAYADVPDADGEGSRSASSRFAEQTYRIGSRLCADGCRACVHQEGGPLHGLLAESTVSRTLIARYLICE